MKRAKYILIRDSQGNKNLWKIVGEKKDRYFVQRCETRKYIFKKYCKIVENSEILHTDFQLDFKPVEYKPKNDYINKYCYNCGHRKGHACLMKNINVLDINGEYCWFFRHYVTMESELE